MSEALHLLAEIQRATGVSLALAENNTADDEKIVSVLEDFLSPYRQRTETSDFLLSFLMGEWTDSEARKFFQRIQWEEATTMVVFLLYFPQGYDDTILEIIGSLFGTEDFILKKDESHLILLRRFRSGRTDQKLCEDASVLVDTLSADALIPVIVSFDSCVENLTSLPASFERVCFAERCGRLFYSSEQIHFYHNLGLGKLVSKLSTDDCEEYLADYLGEFRFDSLDPELESTVQAFFEHDLSIADTARALYVHRNTLVYRLDKFQRLSGLDLRDFGDALTARIAMLMEVYISEQFLS